jgi:hypothetical protein
MAATRLLLAAFCASALAAQDGAALLEKVDRLRHPWPAFSVEVAVKDAKGEQRWRVHARENGDARVEGLSEKEKGRSVLLLGEDMWLLLPNARRPVKVSPAQRLLGPAAGGDLARSRFAQDYEVKALQEGELDGRPCQRLDLQARKPSQSYRTAQLWISRTSGYPLKADYFLGSGKLAKTMFFETPTQVGSLTVLPALRLVDPTGAEATLRFSHWSPGAQDSARFELPKAP